MHSGEQTNLQSAYSELMEQREDTKFNFVTNSPKERENDENLQTNQIVWLLNQCIDNRIEWDHQKLLLWDQSVEQGPDCPENALNAEMAMKSEINLQLEEDDYQEILSGKEDIKTPDFLHPLEPLSPVKISFNLESEEERTGREEEHSHGKCNCKKSKCLKMYCECFRAGRECKDCACVDCKNNSQDDSERKKAIRSIQEREPTAFSDDSQYKGCKCSKSQCIKGYCECFLNGHICGKYCRCRDCLNCKKNRPAQKKKARKSKI